MRTNLTFRGGEPFWANACVGNNGMPNYYHYAKGFSEAANLLIKGALSKNGCQYPVDTFIYPICFNMRHSVELRLKGAVEILMAIAKLRNPPSPFNLEGSHDIGKIWSYFKSESTKVDDRLGFYTKFLDDYILDMAEVDATGQTFRYPYDNSNEKHLVAINTINICLLYERFKALELLLDSFESFMGELLSEYAWGTYTKHLTRPKILAIAAQLPSKDQWGNPEFKTLKEKIKSENSIGSKEFSEAVVKITNLYRTADSGIPAPEIKFLSLSDIQKLVECWLSLNPSYRSGQSETTESLDFNDAESVRRVMGIAEFRHTKLQEIIEELADHLDIDKLSDINAIYECGDSSYPENYPFLVEYYQKEFQDGSHFHAKDREFSLSRLLRKPNFLDRTLKCLYLIGHQKTAETIITAFGLSDSLDWLAAARANEFFINPCSRILASCLEAYGKLHIQSLARQPACGLTN